VASDSPASITVAIQTGDVTTLESLLKADGGGIGVPRPAQPFLCQAALFCQPAAARMLLQHGDPVNVKWGPDHLTPLLAACESSCPSVARVLLDHGADPHAATANGVTPLMAAAWWGSQECVRLLLQHDPDLLAVDLNGHDGIYFAASRGHVDCLRMLLEAGSEVGRRTIDGRTALCAAARSGSVDCVKLLLKYGAEVNEAERRSGTPLVEASKHCHPEVLRVLLQAGAKISMQAMEVAADHACPEAFRILLGAANWPAERRMRCIQSCRNRVEKLMRDQMASDSFRARSEACLQVLKESESTQKEGVERDNAIHAP